MTDKEIYYKGISEGIRLFAWWKNGEQYVGTTGRTYKEAVMKLYNGEYDHIIPSPEGQEVSYV